MAMNKSLGAMNPRPVSQMNARPTQPLTPQRSLGQQGSGQYSRQPAPMQQSVRQSQAPVKNLSSQSNKQPATESAYKDSVINFVDVMKSMVGGFALLDEETIQNNVRLSSENIMSFDDRTISFECADYLVSNAAYILMGLVMDNNFKQAFLDSLMIELQIDKKPEDEKAKIRASMKDNKTYKSTGSIVLGVTTFTPTLSVALMDKMQQGFDKLDAYADEFDAEVAKLTVEQRSEYGFIFSNFMYMLRAFTHNDMFMSYVITVIEKVKTLVTPGK